MAFIPNSNMRKVRLSNITLLELISAFIFNVRMWPVECALAARVSRGRVAFGMRTSYNTCRGQGISSFNVWPTEFTNTVGKLQIVCTGGQVEGDLSYGYNATTVSGQPSTCPNATRTMKNVPLDNGQIFYRSVDHFNPSPSLPLCARSQALKLLVAFHISIPAVTPEFTNMYLMYWHKPRQEQRLSNDSSLRSPNSTGLPTEINELFFD